MLASYCVKKQIMNAREQFTLVGVASNKVQIVTSFCCTAIAAVYTACFIHSICTSWSLILENLRLYRSKCCTHCRLVAPVLQSFKSKTVILHLWSTRCIVNLLLTCRKSAVCTAIEAGQCSKNTTLRSAQSVAEHFTFLLHHLKYKNSDTRCWSASKVMWRSFLDTRAHNTWK